MVKGNKRHQECDTYKTSIRVIKQVDMLILSLTQPVFFSKKESENRTDDIGENDYLNKKDIMKRSKKYTKQWKKLFKKWKSRLDDGVQSKQGGIFGLFAKKELTEQDRDEVVDGIFDETEVYELYEEDFVKEEMDADFKSVLNKIAILIGISIDTAKAQIKTNFIQEFIDFAKRIVASIVGNAKSKVQSTILYGIEQGKTTREIVKEIKTKFDYYEKKEAERIVRTEVIRASTRGSIAGYDYMGVSYYELLTSIDACPICKEIASKGPYKIEDKSGYAPLHPSCRCTVVPVVDSITD